MRLVFLGPPGSGKGTQGRQLGQRLLVPAISTGDMLREAVREGTALGRRAKAVMDSGELVPDDVVVGLIRERIAAPDAREGFVLDGFPRTVEQAHALERLLVGNGAALDAVINLSAPEGVLVERLLLRASSDGRSDDRPETVRERLRVYREKTEPLVSYYRTRGLLTDVDGVGEIAEVAARIDRALAGAERTAGRA